MGQSHRLLTLMGPLEACNGQRADVTPVRTQAPLRWAVTHTDSKSDRALVAVLRALTEVFTLLDSLIFPDIQTFFSLTFEIPLLIRFTVTG